MILSELGLAVPDVTIRSDAPCHRKPFLGSETRLLLEFDEMLSGTPFLRRRVMGNFARFGAIFFLVLASVSPAHAYVDPGSGTFILQVLAAMGAGALFYFAQARAKIGAFFSRFRKSKDENFREREGSNREITESVTPPEE